MGTNQFIASLVQSLAWPAAVVVIAALFRVQLRQLLGGGWLRRLKAGPIEAEFARVSARVLTELPEVRDRPGAASLTQELGDIADTSPRGTIIEAYLQVLEVLRDGLSAVDEQNTDTESATRLARRAVEKSLISRGTADAIEGLTVMRNLAVHDPRGEVTAERAQDYLVLADATLYALRSDLRRSGDGSDCAEVQTR